MVQSERLDSEACWRLLVAERSAWKVSHVDELNVAERLSEHVRDILGDLAVHVEDGDGHAGLLLVPERAQCSVGVVDVRLGADGHGDTGLALSRARASHHVDVLDGRRELIKGGSSRNAVFARSGGCCVENNAQSDEYQCTL